MREALLRDIGCPPHFVCLHGAARWPLCSPPACRQPRHDLSTAKRCMSTKFYRPRGAFLAPPGGWSHPTSCWGPSLHPQSPRGKRPEHEILIFVDRGVRPGARGCAQFWGRSPREGFWGPRKGVWVRVGSWRGRGSLPIWGRPFCLLDWPALEPQRTRRHVHEETAAEVICILGVGMHKSARTAAATEPPLRPYPAGTAQPVPMGRAAHSVGRGQSRAICIL
jgi:hypothetical protein